jgi:hypothetical protein
MSVPVSNPRGTKLYEIQEHLDLSDVWVARAQEDGTVISQDRVNYRNTLRDMYNQALVVSNPESLVLPPEPVYVFVPTVQWIMLTFGSTGIANTPGFVPLRFRVTKTKVVSLEGVLDFNPGITNAMRPKLIATLPPEASPGARLAFKCPGSGTNDPRIEINTNGQITFEGFWNGTATVSQMSLCGIIFTAFDPRATPAEESTVGDPERISDT